MIDPLLLAPFFGSLLLGIGGALLGSILFLQKKVLISETISHAIYPGALLGILVLSIFGQEVHEFAAFIGAFISGWLGLKALQYLEQKLQIKADAALSAVLSLFFGFGVLIVSLIQNQFPLSASYVQTLLFGQAATLSNATLPIYGISIVALGIFLFLCSRILQIYLFDQNFAASSGIRTKNLQKAIFFFLLLFVVLSIRCVGVVMVAGVVIAPAIGARQWTHRLSYFFYIAAIFGALSGAVGCLFSVYFELPTGPTIVLTNACFSFFSLLFSPKKGLIFRKVRQAIFTIHCMEENVLKGLWKKGSLKQLELRKIYGPLSVIGLLFLRRQGWVVKEKGVFALSEEGRRRAESIVRLHRLWELYLTEEFGWRAEKVHASAEEMEHILTPDLEKKLTLLLANPTKDPHEQPIPQYRFNRGDHP